MSIKLLTQGQVTLTKLLETIQVKLTNEFASIPCDSSGVPIGANPYEGASTIVEVFMGAERVSSENIEITSLSPYPNTVSFEKLEDINKISITSIPYGKDILNGYIDIGVSANIANSKKDLGVYRFNFSKVMQGKDGYQGNDGFSYTIDISGGSRGIVYNSTGTLPVPNLSEVFTAKLLKNGSVVENVSYSWSCGGNLTPPDETRLNTFTPIINSTIAKESVGSFVSVSIIDIDSNSEPIVQTIPIICVKSENRLDWIDDWDGKTTLLDNNKFISPRIFAGFGNQEQGTLSGVGLGRDLYGAGNNTTGILGLRDNKIIFSLNDRGQFLVSGSNGDANAIINGTNKGLYFDGATGELYISGKVKISSGQGSSIGGKSVDDVISGVQKGEEAKEKVDNLKVNSRNLIYDSKVEMETTDYLIKKFTTTVSIEPNAKYTLVIDGITTESQQFAVYMNNGTTKLGVFPKNQNGVAYITITGAEAIDQEAQRTLMIYNFPSVDTNGTTEGRSVVLKWIALYGGEIVPPLDWIRAQEDVDKSIYEVEQKALDAEESVKSNKISVDNLSKKFNDITADKKDPTDDALEVDGNVYIRGELITDKSITGESICVGSFTIRNKEKGRDTFVINQHGDVKVNGTFESDSFDEAKNLGYRITPEGDAILNQAVVRGSVELPNAGMTNYGGQIGNKNLFVNYPVETELADYKGVGSFSQFLDCLAFDPADYIGEKFTISLWAKSPNGSTTLRIYNKNQSPKYFYFDAVLDTELSTKWKYYTYTFTNSEITANTAIYNRIEIYAPEQMGVIVKEIKIEQGDKATPWCPNEKEQGDYVRFWAGKSFLLRDSAPFRVTQSGDVYATNATLTGVLFGSVDSGFINIDNKKITIIDDTSASSAPIEYAKINTDSTIFNTREFILGCTDDANYRFRYRYDTSTKKSYMNIVNTDVSLAANNLSVALKKEGSWSNSLVVSSAIAGSVGSLAIGYATGTWANTTIITSLGEKGSTYGDINIRRYDTSENVNLQVEGDITLRSAMKGTNNGIEMRSIKNEGWGFYVI